jgi:hypothetical protein
MAEKKSFIKGLISGAGAEFRESPLKFSASIAILALVVYIFIGDLNIKAEHGDTKIEVSTDTKVIDKAK